MSEIEKLKLTAEHYSYGMKNTVSLSNPYFTNHDTRMIVGKINEVIEKLNKLDENLKDFNKGAKP